MILMLGTVLCPSGVLSIKFTIPFPLHAKFFGVGTLKVFSIEFWNG